MSKSTKQTNAKRAAKNAASQEGSVAGNTSKAQDKIGAVETAAAKVNISPMASVSSTLAAAHAVLVGNETKVKPDSAALAPDPERGSDKLNAAEKLELETREAVITQGNKSFFELGDALNAINRSKLYRESYPTFEDYIEKRWLMSRPNAYRRMFAAEIMAVLTPEGGTLPRNESQLRPFSMFKVEQAEWKTMWKYIVKEAKNRPLTAVLIAELILKKQGKLPSKSKKKAKNFSAAKPLKNKLKVVLGLVADARKKFDTGQSVKSLLARIETKLKALNFT